MKSILITGCSSGIGLQTAHDLRQHGWQVLATCRKQADCDTLEKDGFTSFTLDYADPQSVKDASAQALELCEGKLQAVFNNGAFASPGLVEDLPREALRDIFETNVIGQIDLINQLLPVMRAQGEGTIINCSSVLGFTGLPFRGAYCASKFALEGLSDVLRMELRDTPIHVVLIEPGPITSQIRENSIPHFEKWINVAQSAQRERYESEFNPRLYKNTNKPDRFELPASAVSAKVIKILDSNNPRPRYYVTTPTYISGVLKRLLSTRSFDSFLARW